MATPALPQYVWLVVMGAFGAFGFGWGTGANDVANAFGTSVGAKTLTLRQATVIAAIFEFAGALLLGRVVTSVIAGGIADPSFFVRQPEVYAYGMVCALGVGTIWLAVASYLGYNVSSTHTIIGGIMGFALIWGGGSAVQWATPDPAAFPPYKGVVPIILSWFFSPVLTGIASASIFFVLRTVVLRHENAYNRSFWVFPVAVLITTYINIFFVFAKGAAKTLGSNWGNDKNAWVSAIIAGGLAVLTAVVVVPLLKKRSAKHHEDEEKKVQEGIEAGPTVARALDLETIEKDDSWFTKLRKKSKNAALYGTSVDIHQIVEEDPMIGAMHERAEKFDPRVEHVFGYLQVFSAICVIFAHGAGEVGFMAGPLSAIYDIYMTGVLHKSVQSQIWCVMLGAVSLVIGLATYGYKVTQAMGTMLAKLTPSRGFAAELATALIILVASQLGLPTSSSQCITGGIVGVGLMEGIMGGVNWKHFAKQFASWLCTLFIVGLGVAAVFAQGVYSPSKVDGNQVVFYEDRVTNLSRNIYKNFNTTLQDYYEISASGALTQLPPDMWNELNNTVNTQAAIIKNLTGKTYSSVIDPEENINHLYRALDYMQQYSIFSLGQETVFPGNNICNTNVTSDMKDNITVECPEPKMVPSWVKPLPEPPAPHEPAP